MKVRQNYSVTVGGECVFTGSYKSALKVYDCLSNVSRLLSLEYSFEFPPISISFQPVLS